LLSKYTLIPYPLDVTHPVEKEFPVDIVLSQREKFNLNVERSATTDERTTIGIRFCQIEVA